MRSSPEGSGLAVHLQFFRGFGISPTEVFRNTPGKNAADIALVMDVMTELSRARGEAFCIVSGDALEKILWLSHLPYPRTPSLSISWQTL